jgi:hypothetical protein
VLLLHADLTIEDETTRGMIPDMTRTMEEGTNTQEETTIVTTDAVMTSEVVDET